MSGEVIKLTTKKDEFLSLVEEEVRGNGFKKGVLILYNPDGELTAWNYEMTNAETVYACEWLKISCLLD